MELTLIEPRKQGHGMLSGDSLAAWEPLCEGAAGRMLQFGRFHVLLRQRQLLADGAPVELGSRAFDVLLVLIEANGSLVTKDELVARTWPGVVVSPDNLKVQICALRNALGKDRDFIRTESGRGYRFTAAVHRTRASGTRHLAIPHATDEEARDEAALTVKLAALATQLAEVERKLADMVQLLDGSSRQDVERFRRYCLRANSRDRANRQRPAERRRRIR